MMTEDLRFQEIEHKYIVDERFDLQRFRDTVATLRPARTASIRVRDRYYLTEAGRARRFVIRHRYDAELHHLSVKTLDADTEDAFATRLGVSARHLRRLFALHIGAIIPGYAAIGFVETRERAFAIGDAPLFMRLQRFAVLARLPTPQNV
jgi:AraC-like DNA-binding protein